MSTSLNGACPPQPRLWTLISKLTASCGLVRDTAAAIPKAMRIFISVSRLLTVSLDDRFKIYWLRLVPHRSLVLSLPGESWAQGRGNASWGVLAIQGRPTLARHCRCTEYMVLWGNHMDWTETSIPWEFGVE